MNRTELFKTASGINIEISHSRARDELVLMAVWPCTGGAYQMYRLPEEKFLEKGISLLQFNPPGHGRSEGGMDYALAMECFRECLAAKTDPDLPLIITGHSGGAGASLVSAPEGPRVKRFILVSPVLDSRASLLHMYKINTVGEFNALLTAPLADKKTVLDILSDSEWMNPETWRARGLKNIINSVPAPGPLGTFLEKLFIDGFSALDELDRRGPLCRILLAAKDNWYSQDEIHSLAAAKNIPVTVIEKARDHYFTGAWPEVWAYVLSEADAVLADLNKEINTTATDKVSVPEAEADDYTLKSKFSCSGSGRISRDFRLKDLEKMSDNNE